MLTLEEIRSIPLFTEVLPADASPIFREAQADAEREEAALKPRLPAAWPVGFVRNV